MRTVHIPLWLNAFQFYFIALRRKTDILYVASVATAHVALTHDRLILYPLIYCSLCSIHTSL